MGAIVIIAEDNLFLRPKLESSLEGAGYEVRYVTDAAALAEALEDEPAAFFVNLGSTRLPWEAMIAAARTRLGEGFPLFGYGPHVDADLFDRGRELGCTRVVPNGQVASNAAKIVEAHVARD